MKDDLKKVFDANKVNGFIKVTESPTKTLTSEEKAILNRKGNVLFNSGDINTARRIFLATGYSDGLTRVGDNFLKNGDELTALKYYLLAHNRNKAGALIQKTAKFISALIAEEE
ncbi:MAG: hypothetical protein MJ196_08240 [Treponemataceae bacterium]|nr:hypothetical protein [Treponemataceae bacterium]